MHLLPYLWLLVPISALVFYKFTLRVFFGMVIVPENKLGLVTKKFTLFGKTFLPDGKIIALNGEPGYQADTLAPGLYWFYWPWQYSITEENYTVVPKDKIGLVLSKDGKEVPTGAILARHVDSNSFQDARAFLTNNGQRGRQVSYLNNGTYRINTFLFEVSLADLTRIEDGKIGIITALDGTPLESGTIAGSIIEGNNNFQNFDKFLANGGQRGLQEQVIQAGNYLLNPWAVKVESVAMFEIPISNVGVVISYVGKEGKDVTDETFTHGSLVAKGERGVWVEPLQTGKYAINPYTHKVINIPTYNLVLNWASARSEAHELDKNLSTIKVLSKDGFAFNIDVSQIIHISTTNAPKVIARFGSMQSMISQTLEPLIGNYFRNSAQNNDVISFLTSRETHQKDARAKITEEMNKYNVEAVDTLIGDINPPATLMKTLTDRKIAQEEEVTFDTQRRAQDQRKILESSKALADFQGKMVEAQQSVEISQREAEAAIEKAKGAAQAKVLNAEAEAKQVKLEAEAQAESTLVNAEANAKQITLTGNAEAGKIEAIGNATALAYKQQVEAMGTENFAKFKIIEKIGENKIKIIPDLQINGGGGENNTINTLLGVELLKHVQQK